MSIAGDKPANAVIMDAALPLESSTRVIKTKSKGDIALSLCFICGIDWQ
jgi:hypothetical protein